ncbi:MAG: hypothetical protein AAF715_11390 [Myxococcota bacterium]
MSWTHRWARAIAVAGGSVAFAVGCGGSTDDDLPAAARYVVPASLDTLQGEAWFDHPWPSDARVEAGHPVFRGFYNPTENPLLDEYLSVVDGLLDGFSPVGAGYFRFEVALDDNRLPRTPTDTLAPTATVQLVDVDPDSPDRGRRIPLRVSFRAEAGRYVTANTLSWVPAPGFPLRPATRYVAFVTEGVTGADGTPLEAPATLREVLGRAPARDDATEAWRQAVAADVDALVALGVDPSTLVHFTAFTTGDPTAETFAVADHVREGTPAPTFDDEAWTRWEDNPTFVEYTGRFGPNPNYQIGNLPFAAFGDGGRFNVDAEGRPAVVDTFDLRFSLTVPTGCPQPEAGYPIVLYAHGTGGSYRSHLGYAGTLAAECLASMGVDQIFHGDRPGAPDNITQTQLLFFNFQNVEAGRTNGRQSAIDEIQRARLFTESAARIPATASHTGAEIRFDPDRVLFFGHSQGGLNGPLYLAADASARGGVLSGSSSILSITLLEKTEPSPSVVAAVQILLGLTGPSAAELDLFHPAIMLAQSLVDAIDPIHYARRTVLEPREGNPPKSILITEGIAADGTGDNFSPPAGIEAQAVAMGLPLVDPVVLPIPQLAFGASQVAIPSGGLAGNLAGGTRTGGLVQYAPPPGEDGHFVVFDVAAARRQVAGFLRALADDPTGRLEAP